MNWNEWNRQRKKAWERNREGDGESKKKYMADWHKLTAFWQTKHELKEIYNVDMIK